MVIPVNPSCKPGGGQNEHRDRHHREQRQLPIEDEQHHGDARQGQQRGQQPLQPVDENALHMLRVAGDPAHDFSGRTVFEIAE